MIFLHEVHRVRGVHEEAFEAAFRDGWMPTLGARDDARLLWYCHQAHGTGAAYRVVTITAFRDGGAWERVAERIQTGDLRPWARELDGMRHDGGTGDLHARRPPVPRPVGEPSAPHQRLVAAVVTT